MMKPNAPTRHAQAEREHLHQQAEALTAALHIRQMQTEPGTPDGDRLRRLVKRATHRAERRYRASIPPTP